jgi:hypothetical protein
VRECVIAPPHQVMVALEIELIASLIELIASLIR